MKNGTRSTEYSAYKFERMVSRVFGHEALLTAAVQFVREEPADELTTTERNAADDAAQQAGEYLMKIGKTDFALMTEEERDEFVAVLLVAYRAALRNRLLEQPPF